MKRCMVWLDSKGTENDGGLGVTSLATDVEWTLGQ